MRGRYAAVVRADSGHLKAAFAAFAASGRAYDSRRLYAALQKQGLAIGRRRVRTLMRTTDSRHTMAVSPKVLARQFGQPLAQPSLGQRYQLYPHLQRLAVGLRQSQRSRP